MESEKKDFKGLKKHSVHLLPLLKNQRKETLEYTLNLSDFHGAFPRTTHLYKADKAMLEEICNNINGDFISGEVVHESSDLGLTHKVIIKHRNGSILIFDGLYLRITRILNDCPFNLSDLLSLTGVPDDEFKLKYDFINQCVKPSYPEASEYGYFCTYYTIDETDFGRIGLTRVNNAQARLYLNDPQMFRIDAGIFMKQGQYFSVYIGEEDRINQMIAHDYFMIHEIEMYSRFFRNHLKNVLDYRKELNDCFKGAFLPIWEINIKKTKWNSMKEILISLHETMEFTKRGKLYSEAIEKMVENKIAFFNVPRQIWSNGEELDYEEKVPYSTNHFFEFKVENNSLKRDLESSMEPFYSSVIKNLEDDLTKLETVATDTYNRVKDLVGTYQTEFALDAVQIALIAVIISVVAVIVTLLVSVIDFKSLMSHLVQILPLT